MHVRPIVVALAVLVAAGCRPKDETPPPTPNVDPPVALTSLPTQVLTGSAEYAADITVTRTPELSGTEKEAFPDLTTAADPFTAQWRREVPLSPDAENVFEVTATDAAGNVSEATRVTIVHETPRAETFTLALAPSLVSADDGSLTATASVGNAEAGVDLEALPISFAIAFTQGGPATVPGPEEGLTDAAGRATVRFEGLDAVGVGTVTATEAKSGLTATADFVVTGGLPASITLLLSATVGGTPVGPADAVAVVPATDVTAEIVVTDAPENVINAPFRLFTDAPGARLVGNTLRGVTRAGAYAVVAVVEGLGSVPGLQVSDEAALTVNPGDPTAVELSLSASRVAAGEPVTVTTDVVDDWGNSVPGLTVTVTTTDPAATITGAEIAFATSGAQTITAEVDVDGDGVPDLVRTADIVVEAAAPAAVDLTLGAADIDAVTPGLQVLPDTPIPLTWVVTDAFGNVVSAPVTLATNAPGFLQSAVVVGVERAGSYEVVATVSGTSIGEVEAFEVVPGPVSAIELGLSNTQIIAGGSVTATGRVVDAYDNDVPGETYTLSLTPVPTAPATPVVGATLTVEAGTGTYTAVATLDSDGSITATADFRVVAAPAAQIDLTLGAADADAVTPGLQIVADTPVPLSWTVSDVYGNAVSAAVSVTTNAPGFLSASNLVNVTRVGSYRVVATVSGTGIADVEPFDVLAGPPASLSLGLSSSTTAAGVPVTATGTVSDAFGNVLAAETYTLAVSPVPAAPASPVSGAAITIESTTGSYQVTATVDSDPSISASANLTVNPAAPDPASFVFELLDGGGLAQDPLTVTAGTDVNFRYVVTDAFGNAVPGQNVVVELNDPGALVTNDGVGTGSYRLLRKAGSFTATARIPGTGVLQLRTLVVDPGPAVAIDLSLSTSVVLVGDPVTMRFAVTDAFGNRVPAPSVSVTSSDPSATFSGNPAAALSGDTVTFGSPGTYNVSATEATSGAADAEYVTAELLLDFVPPTVTLSSPTSGTAVAPGSPVIVVVDASDAVGLSSVGYLTTGVVKAEGRVLVPPGTNATQETFSFVVPNNRFGQITVFAFAEDNSGNKANAVPVTIFSDLPNTISCPTCTSFYTAAAGFDEGGVIERGEGGLRVPTELVVGTGGEVYVGLFVNIQLTQANGFLGTTQEEQYISVILPDGTVDAFATLTAGGGIPDQQVVGLAYDRAARTLYASLGNNIAGTGVSRIVAFSPLGIQDPFFDYQPSDREQGLFFEPLSGRLHAVHQPDFADLAYVLDPGPVATTLFTSLNGFDLCGDGSTLYYTLDTVLEGCAVTYGSPSSCGAIRQVSTDPDLGLLASCEVSPSGNVIVASSDTGEVLSVDPAAPAATNATVLITGMVQPIGVAFDPTSGDLLVSDAAQDAVFRFSGTF